jgi:very-short-patch-repair endonuclease
MIMSEERKAVYYGKVELIPGVICDGYVLDDGTAVMSERGTADLLGMDHAPLKRMVLNWPPKSLKPFINNDFSMVPNLIEVTAKTSPYQGRKIVVYTAETIETLIFAYAMALAHDVLREKQKHIGKRCVILMRSLVKAALDAAIREACGLSTDIQTTVRKHLIDPVALLRKAGFKCSVSEDIATLQDMVDFFGIPKGTIRGFINRNSADIQPIPLNRQQILASGSGATRMNGYRIIDVAKLAFRMNTVRGIQLKRDLFGEVDGFAHPDTSAEVCWQAVFALVFSGLGFYHNYPLGRYRVDFKVDYLNLVLECNGYEHRYYNAQREQEREQFITRNYSLIRFHHKTSVEALFNAILQIGPKEIIRLEYTGSE